MNCIAIYKQQLFLWNKADGEKIWATNSFVLQTGYEGCLEKDLAALSLLPSLTGHVDLPSLLQREAWSSLLSPALCLWRNCDPIRTTQDGINHGFSPITPNLNSYKGRYSFFCHQCTGLQQTYVGLFDRNTCKWTWHWCGFIQTLSLYPLKGNCKLLLISFSSSSPRKVEYSLIHAPLPPPYSKSLPWCKIHCWKLFLDVPNTEISVVNCPEALIRQGK